MNLNKFSFRNINYKFQIRVFKFMYLNNVYTEQLIGSNNRYRLILLVLIRILKMGGEKNVIIQFLIINQLIMMYNYKIIKIIKYSP